MIPLKDEIHSRISWLMDEVVPLTQHDDLAVDAKGYDADKDTIYLDVMPKSAPLWADTAYHFSDEAKYDRDYDIFGIDGQPRVSYSGQVWARYISDFMNGSKVVLNVWSQQPSHSKAEEQLMRLYGKFQERDGLEPIEVFQKFM